MRAIWNILEGAEGEEGLLRLPHMEDSPLPLSAVREIQSHQAKIQLRQLSLSHDLLVLYPGLIQSIPLKLLSWPRILHYAGIV